MKILKLLGWINYRGKINATEILLDIVVFTVISLVIYITSKAL